MILIARCPNCDTVFRLTVTQLQAQDGKVCCGQCRCVFNAFSTLSLVAESQIASITPMVTVEQGEQPTPAVAEMVDAAGEAPDFLAPPKTHQKTSRSLWVASCFLLIVLLWQFMHGYRSELAIASPAWRTFLENYCAVMQCSIALPKQLALLSLESSELQFNSDDASDEISLTAIIRNHAVFPQQLPILLLSLTDVNDRVVASQRLRPQDYIAPEAMATIQAGFPPQSEIVIQRHFRLETIEAMGYRLELYY